MIAVAGHEDLALSDRREVREVCPLIGVPRWEVYPRNYYTGGVRRLRRAVLALVALRASGVVGVLLLCRIHVLLPFGSKGEQRATGDDSGIAARASFAKLMGRRHRGLLSRIDEGGYSGARIADGQLSRSVWRLGLVKLKPAL